MAELPTIKSGWLSFKASVIPPQASPLQQRCMEEAFYAGAHCMAEISMTVALLTPDTEAGQDAGVAHLQSCRQEMRDFVKADKWPQVPSEGDLDG